MHCIRAVQPIPLQPAWQRNEEQMMELVSSTPVGSLSPPRTTPRPTSCLAVMTIDIDDWMANTNYQGYFEQSGKNTKTVKWFWEIVSDEFDHEQRARLLQFSTGKSSCLWPCCHVNSQLISALLLLWSNRYIWSPVERILCAAIQWRKNKKVLH